MRDLRAGDHVVVTHTGDVTTIVAVHRVDGAPFYETALAGDERYQCAGTLEALRVERVRLGRD